MRALSPVVWREGMHLAQHHFQQQSRYVQDQAAFVLTSLHAAPYGLVALELDAAALRNGTASITHARGVMPDGLAFEFPADTPPEPLSVRDGFSPTRDGHVLCLTIPRYQAGRANCAVEGDAPGDSGGQRFRAKPTAMVDEVTGTESAPVEVAEKNFRLELDADPEAVVSLPIARVVRDGSGMFTYDPAFVPPSLQIAASPRLMDLLTRLVEMLHARATRLRQERAGAEGQPGAGELVSFWFSHAVHSALAPLRHLHVNRRESPERLYVEMARLAGALCTFSMELDPRMVPLYDHDRLTETFGELERMVHRGLELIVPTGSVAVPLRPMLEAPGAEQIPPGDHPIARLVLLGGVEDRRCLSSRSAWYLGVRSSLPAAEVAAKAPGLIKLCSARHIVRLVREAYPGLTLEHLPMPPADIRARPGTEYFRLGLAGPCWMDIVKSTEVGAFAPAALSDLELDLQVVVEP